MTTWRNLLNFLIPIISMESKHIKQYWINQYHAKTSTNFALNYIWYRGHQGQNSVKTWCGLGISMSWVFSLGTSMSWLCVQKIYWYLSVVALRSLLLDVVVFCPETWTSRFFDLEICISCLFGLGISMSFFWSWNLDVEVLFGSTVSVSIKNSTKKLSYKMYQVIYAPMY